MPGSGEKPGAYWVSTSASAVLAGSWLLYWAYLLRTPITKQSVFMGEITFYAAMLLAVSGLAVAAMAGSTAYLAATRCPPWRWAAAWAAASLVIVALAYAATRTLISSAI